MLERYRLGTALLTLLLFSGFATSPARADILQFTPYLGVDAMIWEATADDTLWRNFRIEDSDVISPEFSSTGVRFRGGVNILRFLGVEAHVGMGGSQRTTIRELDNEDELTAPISVGYRVDRLTSAFVRGILPLGNDIGIYGLLGITEVKGTHRLSDEPGFSQSSQRTTTGTSFGGGVEARLLENLHLTLEYVSYVDETDLELTALLGGLRWSF